MTESEIKELKVAHVMCKQELMFSARYFFHDQYKRKLKQWQHLVAISNVLERVLSGELSRVIINLAPRYGKTEIGIKQFIPHGLAINPAAKFIHTSYSDTLALDNSEAAKDVVSSERYQLMFPDVRIKQSSDSKKKWYTTAGGGVYATSSGGQITGFGAGSVDEDEELGNEIDAMSSAAGSSWLGSKAKFAGAILIDDPNKPDDADSEVLRHRVNDRFDSTISNRVNSRHTPIIIFQQRTHPDDLSGYLIRKQGRIEEGGLWYVLSLPSINEDGTALCPDKHTIEELRALERHNEVVFQRQHMQNPKPKAGLLFPEGDLIYFDASELTSHDYCYICCDPANEGGDDFAAGVFKLVGESIYLVDVIYNTEGADFNEKALVDLIIKNNPAEVGVEAVFGWVETAYRVEEAATKKGFKNEFRQLRPRTNKHSRIMNRSSFVKNNFRFRKDWQEYPQYGKFMRCLTSYLRVQEAGKSNKHDDAPDLCEMAASFFEKNFTHLWQIPENK